MERENDPNGSSSARIAADVCVRRCQSQRGSDRMAARGPVDEVHRSAAKFCKEGNAFFCGGARSSLVSNGHARAWEQEGEAIRAPGRGRSRAYKCARLSVCPRGASGVRAAAWPGVRTAPGPSGRRSGGLRWGSEISPGDLDIFSGWADAGAGDNGVCVNSRNLRSEMLHKRIRGCEHGSVQFRPCQRQCGSEPSARMRIALRFFAR